MTDSRLRRSSPPLLLLCEKSGHVYSSMYRQADIVIASTVLLQGAPSVSVRGIHRLRVCLFCKQRWRLAHFLFCRHSRTPARREEDVRGVVDVLDLILYCAEITESWSFSLKTLRSGDLFVLSELAPSCLNMLRQTSRVLGCAVHLQNALVRPVIVLTSQVTKRHCATEIPEKHRDKFDPENPNLTKFEVVNEPELWKYVERIIPSKRIPPCPTEGGPSGWIPPRLTREEVGWVDFHSSI